MENKTIMKNIHLLPTDKPSRIIKSQDNDFVVLNTDAPNWFGDYLKTTKQHIYITSDDKFVKDEYITDGIEVIKASPKLVDAQGLVNRRDWKKIILTTDQDLIKDGVQSIDDEFLEWFVKNPTCEEIGVKKYENGKYWTYEIIISKEEPKQETLINDTDSHSWGFENFEVIKTEEDAKIFVETLEKITEPNEKLKKAFREYEKQETLEEAFYKTYFGNKISFNSDIGKAFELGAKWQQEQEKNKYSEEEVLEILVKAMKEVKIKRLAFFDGGSKYPIYGNLSKWFEQFKKK